MSLSRVAIVVAIAAAIVAWVGLGVSSGGHVDVRRMVVHEDPPHLREGSTPAGTPAPGDLWVFESTIATEDGAMKGILTQSVLVVEQPGTGIVGNRLTDLVFDFDGQGSIVVAGGATLPDQPAASPDPMAAQEVGKPLLRPIVMTTGTFEGGRGHVISTLAEDGSFTHEITLENRAP